MDRYISVHKSQIPDSARLTFSQLLSGNTRADVIVEGVFRDAGLKKFGHLDWADAEFVVENLEFAKPVKSPRPNKRLQLTVR